MNYKEEKDKYDLIFHRELSDREFAEAMYERWQDAEEVRVQLLEDFDELQEEYAKAREELARPHIGERWRDMIEKIEAILGIPADSHEIEVTITETDYRINCCLMGIGEEDEREF